MDWADYFQTGTLYLLGGYSGWRFLLHSLNFLSCSPFDRQIQTQEELEKVVKEEAEKLSIEHNNIECKYDALELQFLDSSAMIKKLRNKDRYQLLLEKGRYATRKIVRHELYHLAKKHLEHRPKNIVFEHLDYLCRREIQATLYGTFGIKI